MSVEFILRDYQEKLWDAFTVEGYKKILAVWPRRCLAGHTLIRSATGARIPIKELNPGDSILSFNGEKFVPDTIKAVWKTDVKQTYKIKAYKKSIICSADHRFACLKESWNNYTQRIEYRQARHITPDTYVMVYNHKEQSYSYTRIIKFEDDSQHLYDIETEKYHNFIANDFVVHNSGKDMVAWNLMIREALKRVGVYFYCLPTFKQARLVIFDSITNDGLRFKDFIPSELVENINSSEMKITLKNRSIIQLIGSDTYDTSLVGTNAVMIVFSEMALANPLAYQYVRPLLNANDGKVIILSTPRSKNFFYDMYKLAEREKDWFCQKLTIDDTKHISKEHIQKEIDSGEMSEDLANQEYLTSFDRGQEGTVYGKIIDKLRFEGHITNLPWDPRLKVHTAWDLGMSDSTAIILYQIAGTAVNIIEYYENSGKGLPFYINYLQQKDYTWGIHTAPHDIKVRELGTGLSRIETAKSLGINFTIAPSLSLEDGIEAVRALLPRIYFNESSTRTLIKHLESYHYEFDAMRNVYSRVPVHDGTSHSCDALRMLALTLPKTQPGMTADESQREYHESLYGHGTQLPHPFRNTYR